MIIEAESPARRIVRYLVVRAMAGKSDFVEALSLYMDFKEAPRELSLKYGYPRYLISAAALKIVEKADGDRRLARAVVRLAAPIIVSEVMPRVEREKGIYRCMLCGKELIKLWPEDHLLKRHRRDVEDETKKIIDILREKMRAKAVQRWSS